MPVPVTRDEFLDVVRKSRLLDEERLSAFERAMTDEGVPLDQPRLLALRMLRDGLLTKFQAEQLLQGKFRRFLLSDKYQLLEPIGAGGMGQVFLCRHIYMHRLVALKVLPVDKLKDPSMIERFYREARAAAVLDHPNIVRAYDIDREEGEPGQSTLHYLVMEFVDGVSLHDIIGRGGPLPPGRAAHYIMQAARGLEHAHEAGLVHRDVKPGNLLLDRSGTVKVLDLGLARFFEPGKDNVTERYDEKNAVLGTADYLAPEQARGDAVDIRADIYGLGATFYYLLTGRGPFEEGSIAQKLLWAQTKPPKPIRELRPEVPADLAAVVERMMAKKAEQRYQTPQAVVEALAPWTATPIPPPSPEEMPRRSAASNSPSSLTHAPVLPPTPSPRSVPSDLLARRPGSAAPAAPRSGTPKSPATNPAPRTPAPAKGPGSKPLAPIVRGPAPRSAVRRRPPTPEPTGISAGVIIGAAVGGAGLLFVGIFIAWLIKRPSHHDGGPSRPAAPPVAEVPSKQLPAPNRPIRPEETGNYYNQQVTVEMTVMSAGKSPTTDLYFLNSKVNYRAEDNFSLTLEKRVLDQFAAKGISGKDGFVNKKIRVSGKITKYQNKPQIVVERPDQIQILGG